MDKGSAPTVGRFWRGKRVWISGHTGFKGPWLCLWLRYLGAKVAGYSLEPPTDPSLFQLAGIDDKVHSTPGDVRDLAHVSASLEEFQPDIVFHLAAQSIVRESYRDPIRTLSTNVLGTAHVLEALRKLDSVRAVVVVTSDKCYHNREWPWSYRENEALGGHDPYSASKACAEHVAGSYRHSFFESRDVGIASARAGNVIGGGDWARDRLLPDCLRALAQRESIVIRNPHAVRPWQHVLEPLSGYLRLAERLCQSASDYSGAWNFGPSDADTQSVADIVDRVIALWGDDSSWTAAAGPHPHEAQTLRVDSSKARSLLDWQPRLDLDSALAWTVGWYRRYLDGAPIDALTIEQIQSYERWTERDSDAAPGTTRARDPKVLIQ